MEILVNFNDIVCGGADVLRILRFVFILLDMVCWIVPMGLIVMLMVDFGKNVIAGKEDEMKKNLNMVIKRIIYCIILFLVPTIVNFAVGIVSNVGVEAAKCIEIARDHNNDLSQYEIDYEIFEPAGDSEEESNTKEETDNTNVEVNDNASKEVVVKLKYYEFKSGSFTEKDLITNYGSKYYDGYIDLEGKTISLKEAESSFSGNTMLFYGWYSINGDKITDESIVSNENTHTLYAKWWDPLDKKEMILWNLYVDNESYFKTAGVFYEKTWEDYKKKIESILASIKTEKKCASFNYSFNNEMSIEQAIKFSKNGLVPGTHELFVTCNK